MVYDTPEGSVLFVHIPRNAGRYVDRVLVNNGITIRHNQEMQSGKVYHQGKMLLHLTADESEYFHEEEFPRNFCVVRHPLDHFISAHFAFEDQINARSSASFFKPSYEIFEELMERVIFTEMFDHSRKHMYRGMVNMPDALFTPQHEFIKEDTLVWRYEDGMGYDFRVWLRDTVGLPIDVNQEIDQNYQRNPLLDTKNNIPEDQLEFYRECVRTYYAEDFSTFQYS
jgi:hypothetical protein